MTKSEITALIKKQASIIGFDACGIAEADFLEKDADYLRQWLQSGAHGEMAYLKNYFEKRVDPRLLVENAKSVIVVLLNYFPEKLQNSTAPQVAKYAYGADYHYLIKSKLYELKDFIDKNICAVNGTAFCDSAPVLERRWAEKAGLGWIGKNTNLINPQMGSFFFIGELIIDLELEYDKPQPSRCGNCTCCIDACPTKALSAQGLNASQCIAYLTIEKKGEIPPEFAANLSNCIFGCDICQDVCPWNQKKAHSHKTAELTPSESFLNMTKNDWLSLSNSSFNALFKNSAIKRAGYKCLNRNLQNVRINKM